MVSKFSSINAPYIVFYHVFLLLLLLKFCTSFFLHSHETTAGLGTLMSQPSTNPSSRTTFALAGRHRSLPLGTYSTYPMGNQKHHVNQGVNSWDWLLIPRTTKPESLLKRPHPISPNRVGGLEMVEVIFEAKNLTPDMTPSGGALKTMEWKSRCFFQTYCRYRGH